MSKEQLSVKSKLFKLREWLTIQDAARHLSLMFAENVHEADVLRLALDGHLKLSVNFVNPAHAQRGRLISYEDKKNLPREYHSSFLANLPEEQRDQFVLGLKRHDPFPDHYLDLDDKVTTIEGVWDLPMICGLQYCIEQRIHSSLDYQTPEAFERAA